MIVLKCRTPENVVTFKNLEIIIGGLYVMYSGLYFILAGLIKIIRGFIFSSPIWILLASLIYLTIEFCA